MIRIYMDNFEIINLFFAFSFMGWVLECLVIRKEKGYFENRGFATGPFCIIYGFGAILGYYLMQPFQNNMVLVYIVGAIMATIFEYLTAKLMLRIFGKFWWDYKDKPLNYKGVICLESTLGWGAAAIVIVGFLFNFVINIVNEIPQDYGAIIAGVLLGGYAIDFSKSLYEALRSRLLPTEGEYDVIQ